jgi:hypothetical protein
VYPAYKDHIASHDDINRLKPLKSNSSGSYWFISNFCFLFTILHFSDFNYKFILYFFASLCSQYGLLRDHGQLKESGLEKRPWLQHEVYMCDFLLKNLDRFTNNKWMSMSVQTSQLFDFFWLQHGLPHRVRQQLLDRDWHGGRAKGSVRDHHPTQSQILGNNRDQVSVFHFHLLKARLSSFISFMLGNWSSF